MQKTLEEFQQEYKYNLATPILQQYLDIKFAHQDCVLLFRLGDFYEMFYEDALSISKLLGLTLTKRTNKDESVPMCGVPYHSIDTYLPKIVESGYKIAICEQLESPEEAKKRGNKAIVSRDVVRVITQGTIFEENLLQDNAPAYLAALVYKAGEFAIAYFDISTLEFNAIRLDLDNLLSEIIRINPKEILVSQNLPQEVLATLEGYRSKMVFQVESYFAENKCIRSIQSYYGINSISPLGEVCSMTISSIGAVLQYIELTQKSNLPKLSFPKLLNSLHFVMIDSATRKGLEILCNNDGKIKGSIFDSLNKTSTKSGARLLYKMLSSPLTEPCKINFRLNLIETFRNNLQLNTEIRSLLKMLADPERILSRISMGRAKPKDLIDLKNVVNTVGQIKHLFIQHFGFIFPADLEKLATNFKSYDQIREAIEQTLQLDSFGNVADFGYIKSSYHPRIAELTNLINDAKSVIESLRVKYAKISGIDTLKITENNILGMFVEVTAKQAAKIDTDFFIHRQTTLNNIRFTTAELSQLESQIVNAKSSLISLEREIFRQICDQVVEELPGLVSMICDICLLDVLSSMAHLAQEKNYVRPEITSGADFLIKDGRHPSVENSLKLQRESFVTNDCNLSDSKIWIITGPNMAGKSTFLRQNAIIAVLAQSGFFVPASYAKIGIVDKIFSRIGSSDDLSSGQSTFMIEMNQTSNILAQSTAKSLIILDEVGRGTSTYDGLSIAWSAVEYIHDKIKCRTLFATHYHELTDLESRLENAFNYHVSSKEAGNKLLFLHKIKQGPTDKSYGINVAELAGLPKVVVQRAKDILRELEDSKNKIKVELSQPKHEMKEQEELKKLHDFIIRLDAENMTPRQALESIFKLKELMAGFKPVI